MIAAAEISACRDAAAIAALFRRLGYPARAARIDERAWRRMGVDPQFEADDAFYSLFRCGSVRAYLIESTRCARERCAALAMRLRQLNVMTKIIIVNHCCFHDELSIHDIDNRGRGRRLDISLAAPRPHEIDRLNLLARSGEGAVSSELFEVALSRERVTRQFFERFRGSVQAVREAIAARFPGEEPEAVADEALLILSRVLFLYFVQQKGWLDGNRRFLADQFDRASRENGEFFAGVLLPLFFECLNTPVTDRSAAARRLGSVPYLNGGLFHPSPFEQRHPRFAIANETWERILRKTFEAFTFCVDEADVEASHVDPEMLGKVFESLMAGDERASSGSFYTPREIADSLARNAVLGALAGGDAAIAASLRALLDGEAPIEAEVAAALARRAESFTLLDPACGSGAFLLAALRVLERLIPRLRECAALPPIAGLRQSIVESSLFGVDLKPEAVRLCELRLWLAIVSRSTEEAGEVKPLPNLDRNILQGNSLLGPLDLFATARRRVYREWSFALRARQQLVEAYHRTAPHERPSIVRGLRESDRDIAAAILERAIAFEEAELRAAENEATLFPLADRPQEAPEEARRRIAAHRSMQKRVARGELEFFSFDVHFAHVLARGGFDVVLGNPPWVRTMRIEPAMRKMIADRFEVFRGTSGERKGFAQPDLSLAFLEKALALVAPDGVVSMLVPAKLLNAGYASRLRRLLIDRTRILRIDDWTARSRQLFEADTFPVGLSFTRARGGGDRVEVRARGGEFDVRQRELSLDGDGSPWPLMPPEVRRIIRGIFDRFDPLQTVLNRMPLMGVKTGANERFFLDRVVLKNGCAILEDHDVEVPLSAVCRSVRGRDIQRWRARESVWMLWPPLGGWHTPPPWALRLADALGIEARELRLSYARPEHLGIKVAWKDVSRGLQAVVLPASVSVCGRDVPLVPNQTVYSIDAATMDEAFLLTALFNSVVVGALAVSLAERAKDDHQRYMATAMARIPLPRIDPESAAAARLVRIARRAQQEGAPAAELDEIVRRLYGLDAGELAILESYLRSELGKRDGR